MSASTLIYLMRHALRCSTRQPLCNKRKVHLGLVNVFNSRGLGTESRILQTFFKTSLPEVEFSIFRIPAGHRGKSFDSHWDKSFLFKCWMARQDMIMTIETLMPRLFKSCRENGIRTLWRPNQEWIAPSHHPHDIAQVDCIMTPQLACADFIRSHFGVNNVVANPWIMTLPVHQKEPGQGRTRFLFNAGRGGIGERRNQRLVIEAFAKVLSERSDIEFLFKTQIPIDVSALQKYAGKSFHYTCGNMSYKKNITLYRQADFSLAPSKWEGVGFALLESLYQGTPVLTVDSPPMNEWVDHKQTGYLAPAHLADASTPIPYPGDNDKGIHWVRAAQCNSADLARGIHWLSDNKFDLYASFNALNVETLKERNRRFIESWRSVLDI